MKKRKNNILETQPVTDADLLEQFSSEFSRIKENRFFDNEEVRYDIPPDIALANNSIYTGVAVDGAATSDPVWTIVRVYFNSAKLPERSRIRFNVSWDSRTTGW